MSNKKAIPHILQMMRLLCALFVQFRTINAQIGAKIVVLFDIHKSFVIFSV